MTYVLNALLPICLIIFIGYWFKHISFPSTDFWPKMDKFTYYALMPSLLIYELSIAKIDLSHTINLVITSLLGIFIVLLFLLLINLFIKFDKRAFTSIVQGGIRFNTYVFLALVNAVYGDKGLVLAAIVMAFAIPFLNVLCISIFAIYVREGHFSFKSFMKTIIKNPLIVACLIGGFLNFCGNPIPGFILKSFSIISHAALPMGLLSVGVGLELKYLKQAKKELLISTGAKLIIFPCVAYQLGVIFGLAGTALSIAIIFASMPTATSSHILARELGGDVSLMASITTLETLMCIGTLVLIVPLL